MLGGSHCTKVAAVARRALAGRGCGSAESRAFWVEEMKSPPAERGDQSITDQSQTVRGEGMKPWGWGLL